MAIIDQQFGICWLNLALKTNKDSILVTNEFLKIMIDLIINHALTIKHNNN